MLDVIIDNCAVRPITNRFGDIISACDQMIKLVATPDLIREYREGAERTLDVGEKENLIRLIDACEIIGFFGFGPGYLGFDQGVWIQKDQQRVIEGIVDGRRGTKREANYRSDANMIAQSKSRIVITNNSSESHWRTALEGSGSIIFISDLEILWDDGASFPEAVFCLAVRRQAEAKTQGR